MARHNREGKGTDQRGWDYTISYQPDWLHWIKVTRLLESGRQSTKTLFRNPNRREQDPGPRVRTRIASPQNGVDIEIVVGDAEQVVKRVIVETDVPGASSIVFTIEDENPPPGDGHEGGGGD